MTRLAPAVAFLILGALVEPAMALEKPRYRVVEAFEEFEVREYEPYLVAETEVTGSREEAGNAGFRRLADYIFGKNEGSRKVAMTAPVAQQEGAAPAGEKIAMTAPVSQQERADKGPSTWIIQFMVPSGYTRETLPRPIDPAVTFREVPGRRMAVISYSGTWSEERYEKHLARLRAAMEKAGLRAGGDPIWARYDPPFMPWFLRTNEILVELSPAPATTPATK
jgi:effector-binding domain-containing protein